MGMCTEKFVNIPPQNKNKQKRNIWRILVTDNLKWQKKATTEFVPFGSSII